MGKVLVLYHSASGNTAAMARLVAEGAGLVPGTEVRVRDVGAATPDGVHWCDGLAVGSPTNMGVLSWRMERFWDETMFDHWGRVDGKVACAFSSGGGWGGGAEIACQSLYMVLMNFGFLVVGVTDYAGKITTCHYGAVAAREPRDAEAGGACRLLGRRLAEWVAVVAGGRRDQHPLNRPESRTLPG
jgi:NAD(P)H dehydrogenase (quinone)